MSSKGGRKTLRPYCSIEYIEQWICRKIRLLKHSCDHFPYSYIHDAINYKPVSLWTFKRAKYVIKLVSVIDAEELQQEDTGPEFETEVGNLGIQEGDRN